MPALEIRLSDVRADRIENVLLAIELAESVCLVADSFDGKQYLAAISLLVQCANLGKPLLLRGEASPRMERQSAGLLSFLRNAHDASESGRNWVDATQQTDTTSAESTCAIVSCTALHASTREAFALALSSRLRKARITVPDRLRGAGAPDSA